MNLDQVAGHDLEWRQQEGRTYRLTCGEQELATLHFEKRCGSLASAELGGQRWTFKRTGFLSPRVSVRLTGSETDLAVFSPGWMGSGGVTFAAGRRYQLRHTNFWATEWVFQAEDGTPVTTLAGPHGVFKHGGLAKVTPSAAPCPDTPVLLLLIWYVRLLMHEDASAAAVVVAGS